MTHPASPPKPSAPATPHPGGPEAYEEAAEGKRSDNATSNLEQARAVGQDPARKGSRQGKDADPTDPAPPKRPER